MENESGSEHDNGPCQQTPYTMSRKLYGWFAVLLVAPWLLIVAGMGPQWFQQCGQAWKNIGTGTGEKIQHCPPGPWGNLQFTRIAIEPPDQFVTFAFDPSREIVWIFPGFTEAMLARLWLDVGLGADQQKELMATLRRDGTAGNLVLVPSRGLILHLTPEARARIYTVLGRFPENPQQMFPVCFPAAEVDDWFADSKLSEATVATIKRLLYRRGRVFLFADQELLLSLLETRQERVYALKMLARTSTLLLKLEVSPDADLDALAAYWGRGPRTKDIRSLLTSLPKVPGGFKIDAGHLLPMMARKLLYAYPNPDLDANALRQDCNWTSMNFFRMEPDNRFLAAKNVQQAIETEYYPVLGDPAFGDVLLFLGARGEVRHSCVYVAAGIFYTKNGPQPHVPWCFMELDDVQAIYEGEVPLRMQVFRNCKF